MENYYDKIEIKHVGDLPPEVRVPVMRDAQEFIKRHKDMGDEWLCETLALFKYQVEGAHIRLDDMSKALNHLAIQLGGQQQDNDPETDWWKNAE